MRVPPQPTEPRPAHPSDLDAVLALFHESIEWCVAIGKAQRWGSEPLSAAIAPETFVRLPLSSRAPQTRGGGRGGDRQLLACAEQRARAAGQIMAKRLDAGT